jgi:hypothetical protein
LAENLVEYWVARKVEWLADWMAVTLADLMERRKVAMMAVKMVE